MIAFPDLVRRHGKIVIIATLVATTMILAISTFAAGPTQHGNQRYAALIQAESMKSGLGWLTQWRSQFAKLGTESSLKKSFLTKATANTAEITMRADQCEGAPRAQLMIDGQKVADMYVDNSTFETVKIALQKDLTPGRHKTEVRMLNDKQTSACDRSLYVDKIGLTKDGAAVNKLPFGIQLELGGLYGAPVGRSAVPGRPLVRFFDRNPMPYIAGTKEIPAFAESSSGTVTFGSGSVGSDGSATLTAGQNPPGNYSTPDGSSTVYWDGYNATPVSGDPYVANGWSGGQAPVSQ